MTDERNYIEQSANDQLLFRRYSLIMQFVILNAVKNLRLWMRSFSQETQKLLHKITNDEVSDTIGAEENYYRWW